MQLSNELGVVTSMNRARTAFFVSIGLSAALTIWFIYSMLAPASDLDVAERLPEEILGFGYVSVWVFAAVPQFVLWYVARASAQTRGQRATVTALIVLFAIVSFAGFPSYRAEMARVLGVPKSEISIAKALFF